MLFRPWPEALVLLIFIACRKLCEADRNAHNMIQIEAS